MNFRQDKLAAMLTAVTAVLATLGSPRTACAQTLVIHVENIRAAPGSMRFGFYDTPAQWKTEKSSFQRAGRKRITGGRQTFTYTDIPAGHYAMAVADDENDSGGMDWGMILPKEGFGFSNLEHRGLTRPAFEDFDFELRPGETTVVTVKVRYL